MQGRFQTVSCRRPPRTTVFGPSSGPLGYLARLDALSQAQTDDEEPARYVLTPMEHRILSVYKQYAHNPEVPIYLIEVLIRHFMGITPGSHRNSEHYLYPLDAWLHDLTDRRGGRQRRQKPDDPPPPPRDPQAVRAVLSPEYGAGLIRRDIIEGTHYSITAGDRIAGFPADPPETELLPWLAKEISGMLKQVRKGRVVPVRTGALDESHRMAIVYEVEHLDIPERTVRLDDAAVAMRQNLHDMFGSLRKVLDWHVQTGLNAPLYETRYAVEDGPRPVALPRRRQSEAQWADVQLTLPGQVKEGAISWGSSPDIMAYSWIDAATAADEWHDVIGQREDPRRYISVDLVEARMQRPGVVVSSDDETGWIAQELNTMDLLTAETSVLGHCISRGGYWEQIRSGAQRHLSIRSPVPGMEGRYRPRWTVHLDMVRGGEGGWRVGQIKGVRDALPPHPDVEHMRRGGDHTEFLDEEASVETCRQIARLLEPNFPSYRAANDWVHCANAIRRAEAREAQERQQAKRRGGLLEL